MEDQDLEKKLAEYQELAKQNPDVNVAALMASALEHQEDNNLPTKQKIRAYLVSLALPPFGLIYSIRFYFSGKADGKRAALWCALLTIFTIFISTLLLNSIMSAGNTSVQQLQQIRPTDVQSLFQ